MNFKSLPILSAFLFFTHFVLAQKYEYGISLGGVSYSGDLYKGYNILNQQPGIQGHYRINFDPDISFRVGLLYGGLSGSDSDPVDVLGEVRNASFEREFAELSAVFEYHFVDYKHENSSIRWSPYFFAGVGFTKFFGLDPAIDNFNSIQPVLPFGGGIKHLVGKQFAVSIEYGARKTFFDEMDRISDGDVFDNSNFQFGNPANKDWYHYVGVSFCYILYKIPCTYRYVPNRSLYKK